MHVDSQKYVVINWKGKFYMWIGVPQGLKPASAYFTAMMTHLLNTAIGGAGAGIQQVTSMSPAVATTPTDGMYGGGAAWSVGQWYI